MIVLGTKGGITVNAEGNFEDFSDKVVEEEGVIEGTTPDGERFIMQVTELAVVAEVKEQDEDVEGGGGDITEEQKGKEGKED